LPATATTATVTFIYDGGGNRRIKTISGTNTYFVVDTRNPSGYAQVLEELSAPTTNSTPLRLYTHGLDLICQRQSSGTTSYYGYGGNGNVRFLTATNASVSDTYTYDSFGDLIASTGSTPNNYRYTGEQYDPNLGFYYLRARYSNPNTGRFLSRDSFAGNIYDPASLHRYTYCGDNPINCIDPSGMEFNLKGLLITMVVITVVFTLYFSFVRDSSPGKMKKLPPNAIQAEYNKQDGIIASLEKAKEDLQIGRRFPLKNYGLAVGGRVSVKLRNDKDPIGQEMRNIWEKPTTAAGRATAGDELSARLMAGRGRGLEDFIGGVAFEENAVTDEQYELVVDALISRQIAYKEWLKTFIESGQTP
jgi:RHS repeat-associated protein